MARKGVKQGTGASQTQGLEPVKMEPERILQDRTENREKCPWLRRPRRLRD